jgi:hypothetical protein
MRTSLIVFFSMFLVRFIGGEAAFQRAKRKGRRFTFQSELALGFVFV